MPDNVLEVGGTAAVQASFKDATDAAVTISTVSWSASSEVSLTPDPNDQTKASLFGVVPGTANVVAHGRSDLGSTVTAGLTVTVLQPGAPVSGEISFAATPAPKPATPETAKPVAAGTVTHTTHTTQTTVHKPAGT